MTTLPLMVRVAVVCWLAALTSAAQSTLFQSLDTPVPPAAVPEAIGDLDGDGDADLLTGGAVYVNDGSGRFTPSAAPTLAFQRQGTRLADLNGDGLLDVISFWAGVVRIDLNAGGLTFVGPLAGLPSPPAGFLPGNLAAGDVDGDGDVDLMIATYQAATATPGPLALWLNNGVVVMTPAPAASVPAVAVPNEKVLLRDLDGDGDLDLILAGPNPAPPLAVRTATNAGGVFTLTPAPIWTASAQYAFEVGNFNGDALPDLALTAITGGVGVIAVILNSPAGFLPPVTTAVPNTPSSLVAVDLNGDGVDEIVQWISGGGVSVRTVLPGGSLSAPTQTWTDLLLWGPPGYGARDLDGDGDRDLLTLGAALMNTGTGSLVRVGGRVFGMSYWYVFHAGDLDQDGDPDLVGFGAGNSIATGLNDAGYFSTGPVSGVTLAGGPFYYYIFPFDRDGDGDRDLYAAWNIASPFGGGPSDVVFDDVNGTFTPVATISSGGGVSCFAAIDYDSDGDLDVFLGRHPATTVTSTVGPMHLIQNLGASGFAAPVPIGIPRFTFDLDEGDFDGNGTVDLFQTNTTVYGGSPDACIVYLNSGAGSFTAVPQTFSGYYTAAGDLNGDGMTDVVVDGSVYFSVGAGAFVPGPALPSALVAPAVLADVDLDGDLDLVETQATIMFNAGGGVFGAPVSFLALSPIAPTSWSVPKSSVVDIDRDGDLDILAIGPTVLINTTRQLAHGAWPRPGRPASVDLYGTPGGAWFLYGSQGTANFSFPPWGNVMIDPASAILGAIGTFSAPAAPFPGTASFGVTVPNNPALVGSTSYWQAIDASQMRFTNRLTITVLSY